ncbi:MAG: LexA family transcriptional regulator [Nitratireductor sp.]
MQAIPTLVENSRHKHLAWVKAVMAHRGWNQTELARKAQLDPSTLSRFFREVNPGAMLQSHTIDKIAAVGGIPPFRTEPPAPPRGFQEREAELYDGSLPDLMTDEVLVAVKTGKNGVDPWILRSDALVHAGYRPGDIVIVDRNAEPLDGDIVCAQVYDASGKAETVMRIYEEPYLVAASPDPRLQRPLHVGKDHVLLRGVVVGTWKPRRAA